MENLIEKSRALTIDELLKYSPLNGAIPCSFSEKAESFTLLDRRGKRDVGTILMNPGRWPRTQMISVKPINRTCD
ncbi:hypothetical protein CEXT_545671 [Caerostris extrusa]|uniref:Uncharacterized protein n=1 Tax=Caerostris extrusa TaxID=172846 RepID=A0AAV4W4L6_CAEEX|nr:hypothetical protein CEXT_545671 [Caerostris extrusa]